MKPKTIITQKDFDIIMSESGSKTFKDAILRDIHYDNRRDERLHFSHWENVKIENCKFHHVGFDFSDMKDITIVDSEFYWVSFNRASLENIQVVNSKFQWVDFNRTRVEFCSFRGGNAFWWEEPFGGGKWYFSGTKIHCVQGHASQ